MTSEGAFVLAIGSHIVALCCGAAAGWRWGERSGWALFAVGMVAETIFAIGILKLCGVIG